MAAARKATRVSDAAFLAALTLLAVLAVTAYRVLGDLDNSTRWVTHTRGVLSQSALVHQLIIDIESAARGYSVSGDERMLAPYHTAINALPEALRTLRSFLDDDAEQSRRVAALVPVIQARVQHSGYVIELRDARGAQAAQSLVQAGYGTELMERTRSGLREIDTVENTLLDQRLSSGMRESVWTRVVLLCLTGAALLSLALSWAFSRRALAEVRRLQARAHAGEARLLVTLRSCGDGLIVTDDQGRITMLNPVAQALTGWREEDAKGLPLDQVFRIFNEFTRAEIENPVGRVLREGKVVGLANHTVLVARDGSERPIDDSGAPIRDGSGEIIGAVLVFRDVSARRHAEAARECLLRAEAEREGAVRESAAKDEFLALVSHELRAPLAAIRGWLHLLMSGFVGQSGVPDALQRIYRNTRLQERLVNDLLDVSRIAAGKLEVLRVPIDLVEAVHSAYEECRSTAEQKKVNLTMQCEEARLYVMGDEQRLIQVVSNLLGNAIKFTPPEGCVSVRLVRHAERAVITVADTGMGMTSEVTERLFDRFWQADSSRTRDNGGLGLGLAIAKYLIEEHRGDIAVVSDGLNRGSTLTVTLPVLSMEPLALASTAHVPPESRDLDGVRVLLVDDDADGRDAVQIFLDQRGAAVSVADSAEHALQVFERSRPDVVVSDIGMPQADGYSLAQSIRTLEARLGGHCALIALTGFAADNDRCMALGSGFDDHLGKPIDLEQLAGRIRQGHSRRQA
ncbi:MAG: CHASE3 domain-containing protein [Burkholderiales bacterium]|nr:CHASE3 domain-containing protein [Burkholderiales bacterium]